MDGFGLGLSDFVLSRGGVATKKRGNTCVAKKGDKTDVMLCHGVMFVSW